MTVSPLQDESEIGALRKLVPQKLRAMFLISLSCLPLELSKGSTHWVSAWRHCGRKYISAWASPGSLKQSFFSLSHFFDCFISLPQVPTCLPATLSPRMAARSQGVKMLTRHEPVPVSVVNPAQSPKPWTSCSSMPVITRASLPRWGKCSDTDCCQRQIRPDPGSGRRWTSSSPNHSVVWLTWQ